MSLRKKRILLTRLSFIPIILLAIFVRPRWDTESTGAFVVETAGYFLLLAGLATRLWSILYIGGRKSHELVTDGPYSICRNPLYAGTFLLAIGAGLCFENVLMLIAIFVILVPAHILTARAEQRHLLDLFPQTYPDYAREVPPFWPRLSNYHSDDMLSVTVRSVRRIAIDSLGVLLLPVAEDLLEILHHHNLIPVLYFP